MSRLICSDCKYDIGEYTGDVIKIRKCPQCNSVNLYRSLLLADKIELHENVKGKSNKIPGKKKPLGEFQTGEGKSVSRGRFVDKIRKIDRENDLYFERVIDPETGEIIHECSERLSEHFGHGSAKKK